MTGKFCLSWKWNSVIGHFILNNWGSTHDSFGHKNENIKVTRTLFFWFDSTGVNYDLGWGTKPFPDGKFTLVEDQLTFQDNSLFLFGGMHQVTSPGYS